jgi:hypothetical protein
MHQQFFQLLNFTSKKKMFFQTPIRNTNEQKERIDDFVTDENISG